MPDQAVSDTLLAQSRQALMQGDFGAVFDLAEQAVRSADVPSLVRAQACLQAAMAAWNTHRAERGRDFATQAAEFGRAAGDDALLVQARALLGACLALDERVTEAVAALREAVAAAGPHMSTAVRRTVHTAVGVSYRQLGMSALELAAARQVLLTLEPGAPAAGVVRSWCNLANAAEERWRDVVPADPEAAGRLLDEVLAELPRLEALAGDAGHARVVLRSVFGGLLLAAGRWSEARAFLQEALHATASKFPSSDDWQERVAMLTHLARSERALGDEAAARSTIEQAKVLVAAHGDQARWPWLLRRLADLAELDGDAAGVRYWIGRYHARVQHNLQAAVDAQVASLAVSVNQHVLMHEVRQLQDLVHRDALTGALNRRGIEQAFAATSLPTRVLGMLDIDHFKHINDSHGHPTGDAVLRALARLLATTLRQVDFVGRIGGEEFVLVLSGVDLGGATAYARRLEQAVRLHAWETESGCPRVTLSGGLVDVPIGESFESALARADALLYQAKQGGRDRVLVEPTRE